MSIFKRGGVYWVNFWWNSAHVQRSTKSRNPRTARQIEAALRTALAKGETGIVERKPAPLLKDFAQQFISAIEVRCAAKPRTVEFYAQQLARLLDFSPLANARLSEIDEALIERFVHHRSTQVGTASVNRALATLRRLMRLAQEWRVIDRVPRIRLLSGEYNRDFVLGYAEEQRYLAAATSLLRDVAILILDTGLRVGEAVALEWKDVHLGGGNSSGCGYVQVIGGKTRNARRAIPLTKRAFEMLRARAQTSRAAYVFAISGGLPPRVASLDHMHAMTRKTAGLSSSFVLHSLRHTYLTRLGLAGVEAFTIMRLAGHSSVVVSQRYVHPTGHAVEHAVGRLDAMNQSAVLNDVGEHVYLPPLSATLTAPASSSETQRRQLLAR